MKLNATGAFEVKTTPLAPDAGRPGAFPRLAIDKTFAGGLVGTAAGEMTAFQGASGSAYVALDRFTGSVLGRSGSFLLTHVGTMRPGEMRLEVKVVPGSGTDALTGLEGTLTIRNDAGAHSYVFEGSLPGAEWAGTCVECARSV